MTRIWAAIVGSAALALVIGVLAVLAISGPDRDVRQRSMMDVWGADSDPRVGCLRVPGRRGAVVHGGEYGYLTQMTAHHQEAIAAAEQLSRSERPRLREFGAEIVSGQSAQVAQMEGWLVEWYSDGPTWTSGYRPEMRDLTKLSGDRLDRVFLTDMIGHHMMAVMQSQQLLALEVVEHEEVRVLARTIRDEQRAEISQMVRWLRRWYPAQRPCTPVMSGSMMRGLGSG